jgi:hypothetical protein
LVSVITVSGVTSMCSIMSEFSTSGTLFNRVSQIIRFLMNISAGSQFSLMDGTLRPKSKLEHAGATAGSRKLAGSGAKRPVEANMNSSSGAEMQTLVIPLWPRWGYGSPAGSPKLSPAMAEERREVFESVWTSLSTQPENSDARAACRFLLRHLAATAPGD